MQKCHNEIKRTATGEYDFTERKEVDWSPNERKFSSQKHHRGKNGGQKNERKTSTDVSGPDDAEWIQ